MGLPRWHSGEGSTCQRRRRWSLGFNLWVGKIPWSRKWKLIPVFLPRKFHGQRRLVGYSPWDRKELDIMEHTHTQQSKNRTISRSPPSIWKLLLLLFSHSVVFDYLSPHGPQHARLPWPSPSSGACSNSRPLSRWIHPTLSSSVSPFSSHLQSFPAWRSFLRSQLFVSGGQSIGSSPLASLLLTYILDWFPLGLTGLIFLWFKGLSRVSSNNTVQKYQFFSIPPSLWSNSHICARLLEKP